MPTPPRLVVGFDLDLTLVDSRERVLSAYLRALRDAGADVSREALVPHLGIPLVDTIAAVAPAMDADALVLRYRRYYDEPHAPRTEPMPGAAGALRAVREVGGRTVVVSAKYTPAVHQALAEAGLADLVDVAYGELFAAEKASALAGEGVSIYVGDHPGDMAAAAGTPALAVAVTMGSNAAAVLAAAGAQVILADLLGFPAWFSAHLAGEDEPAV